MNDVTDTTGFSLPKAAITAAFYAAPLLHVVSARAIPVEPFLWSVLLAAFLVALTERDLQTLRLPNVLTVPLIAVGLLATWLLAAASALWHLIAAVVGYSVIVAIGAAYRHWRGRDGIGLGDAKLLAAAGAWLGLAALPSVLLWAALVGLAAVIALRLAGKRLPADGRLPFGPFLAYGIWLVWLYGPFA